jgi:hypothetical protein
VRISPAQSISGSSPSASSGSLFGQSAGPRKAGSGSGAGGSPSRRQAFQKGVNTL